MLIECNECGKEYSDQARRCPHCGASTFQNKYGNIKEGYKNITKFNSEVNIIAKFLLAVLVIVVNLISLYKIGTINIFKDAIKDINERKAPSPDGTYKTVAFEKLFKDLEDNILLAEDEYKGKYIAITGKLGVIDTDKIDIVEINDKSFSTDRVVCYFTNDEQKYAVKNMNKGDIITVKGKISSIGSLFFDSYYLNITEIPELAEQ